MDSTSLTKPVDLQGLSLALAKTKADYEAQINKVAVPPDWEMENTDSFAYIENRPAIRAGEGENSIVEGTLTQGSTAAIYTIYITGAAKATTFSYTTSETLPSFLFDEGNKYCAYIESGMSMYKNQLIVSINSSNSSSGSITFPHYVSTYALSNAEVKIFYNYTIALGKNSHISGEQCVALGSNSYAHGWCAYAIGKNTYANGDCVKAYGSNSHAEGVGGITFGDNSHTEGLYTIAKGIVQHVQGKYNIEDSTNTYAHIVGNGSSTARSNAHTLDWSGNAWYAGKVSAGTVDNPANPTANNDLTTKAYVDANAGGSSTLVDLTDTTISSASNGQVLTYNSTSSKWENDDLPKEIVYVSLTQDENDLTKYIPDKTYDELETAYYNGSFIMAKVLTSVYPLSSITSADAVIRRMNFLRADNANETRVYSWTRGNNYLTVTSSTTAGSLSFSNGVLTLHNAYGNTSSITLPIYNGGVSS